MENSCEQNINKVCSHSFLHQDFEPRFDCVLKSSTLFYLLISLISLVVKFQTLQDQNYIFSAKDL